MSLLSLLQKGGPAGAGAGAGGSGDGAGASGGGAAFGTVLSGSHHTVRTSDAAAVTSLPVNPITVAKFAPGFYRGKLVRLCGVWCVCVCFCVFLFVFVLLCL